MHNREAGNLLVSFGAGAYRSITKKLIVVHIDLVAGNALERCR
jgi:hypothetical protein